MKAFLGLILLVGAVCAYQVPEISVKQYFTVLEKLSNRIVDGELAEIGQYPYIVSLFSRVDANATQGALCGGSIIAYNAVLTAAHCVTGRSAFRVVAGTINRLEGNQTIEFTGNPRVHPEYDPLFLHNDIAIVRLPGGNYLQLNELVQSIPIPAMNHSRLEDEVVTVAGWGITGDGVQTAPTYLSSVDLRVISNEQCAAYYIPNLIVNSTLCALSNTDNERQGTCSGDSGGPLVQFVNDEPVLVGVVSFVSANGCESNGPNGFARASSFEDWIRYEMNWPWTKK